MERILWAVICVVMFVCPVLAGQVAEDTEAVHQAVIDSKDLEIINDLDLFQNWDNLQSEQVLDNINSMDEATTGAGYDQ